MTKKLKFQFLGLMILLIACKKEKTENVIPSSGKIVYISTVDHNYGEIYLCNSNGSDNKRISELGSKNLLDAELEPEFSPDGKKVKFRALSDYWLKVYDMNSGSLLKIAKAWTSAWSSNSNQIAYISFLDLDRPIYIVNSDGSNPQKLTQYSYYENFDTSLTFNGIAWYEKENVIIACSGGSMNNLSGTFFTKIDPQTGKILSIYPLNFNENFSLRGDVITWSNVDTVFFHNIASKNTSYFIASGEKPLKPVLSPDGLRVAYTTNRYYTVGQDTFYYTDIISRNLNGFDKRELTSQNSIPNNTKYKSSFSPFWINNKEILYSAGKIYKIKDDLITEVNALTDVLKAGGQVQMK